MFMGRSSTQILVRKIVESLTKGTKSITELAEATGFDRTAISKYASILAESGLLLEEQEGTSKRFTLIPTYRSDTYFGLPLDQSAEKQVSSVYHLIRKHWNEISSKKLLGTHAQKILYKVISSCDELKVPFGWYIYGGISVVTYDASKEYAYYGLPGKIEDCIKEATADYEKNEHAWEAKKQQYNEEPNALFSTKEEILSILYSPDFDSHPKRSLFVLVKKIRKLISLAPKGPQPQYSEILDAYQDLMLDITNKLGEAVILPRKREITVLFEAIWRYIALFNFKQGLGNFYSQKILDIHFQLDIKQQEGEIVELGTQLQSLVPEDEITDPLKKQLHEALSQMKPLSPEEQKKQKEEMGKLRKELGEERFQVWLLEQAGLLKI